jgi:hypothetical protein
MRRLLAFSAILMLSACSGPQARLSAGLESAGLSPEVAQCMAKKMYKKLSLKQLLRLSSLGSLKDETMSELSPKEFLHKVRALKDPEILSVTTSAGISCAIG